MDDKVKITASTDLDPPRALRRTEHFAFVSPLPLDECIRRLLARNGIDHMARAREEYAPSRAGIAHADMNDTYFALSDGEEMWVSGWAMGTISDVGGRRTRVVGRLGISTRYSWRGFLSVLVPMLVIIALAMLSGPTQGDRWFFSCFAICPLVLLPMAYLSPHRDTKARLRKEVCEVFGIIWEGPLPLSDEVNEVSDG